MAKLARALTSARATQDEAGRACFASVRGAGGDGVGIVAVAGAGNEARLVDAHFDVMVLVGLVGGRGIEGDFVPGVGVGDALLNIAGDVAVGCECEASALDGKHLKAQVGILRIGEFAEALEEALVVVGRHHGFGNSEGIHVVESGFGLAQLRGKENDVVEDLLLLPGVEIEGGA